LNTRLSAALALGALSAMYCGGASAIGLLQAYQAALKHDPQYRAHYYENEGGKEYANIGRAGLRPTVSAAYSYNRNRAEIEQQDFNGEPEITKPDYRSRAAGVQLRQPLYNQDVAARYRQGIAQTKLSEAQFAQRGQELVLRVVGAYIDALYASEQLALARAQRDAYIEQRKVNDTLFQRGEGTRTDMLETQARLDVAEADVLDAQDRELAARGTLSAMVGMELDQLDPLGPAFAVKPLPPGGFEPWKARALAANPELQAQLHAVEAAYQDIRRSRAGHAPRLDLVASYNVNESDTVSTLDQHSKVRSIGVQLNIPLYSGGQVSAASRQAVAAHERAQAELQVRSDKLLIDVRKEYNASLSSAARIAALDKAVASGELLVKATTQSIKGGVRINLDLLNARHQMFTSRRDLAQARYNYLLSDLRLRAAAGALGESDVREMAAHFR
jgi:outer membrane protein, protease secretion system